MARAKRNVAPPREDRYRDFPIFLYKKDVDSLGSGGFGEVFGYVLRKKVWKNFKNVSCPPAVAVKIPLPGNSLNAELDSDMINNLKAIKHQNIVGFYGICEINGNIAVVMELCCRDTLHELLYRPSRKDKGLRHDYKYQKELICGILRGMAHLHDMKIAHRDIKPSNILMVSPDFAGRKKLKKIPKLGDFGFSKRLPMGSSSGESGRLKTVVGTRPYMAPEINKRSDYGFKADVFAFGVTVYELLTGKKPENFKSDDLFTDSVIFMVCGKEAFLGISFLEACLSEKEINRSSSHDLLKADFLKNIDFRRDKDQEGDIVFPIDDSAHETIDQIEIMRRHMVKVSEYSEKTKEYMTPKYRVSTTTLCHLSDPEKLQIHSEGASRDSGAKFCLTTGTSPNDSFLFVCNRGKKSNPLMMEMSKNEKTHFSVYGRKKNASISSTHVSIEVRKPVNENEPEHYDALAIFSLKLPQQKWDRGKTMAPLGYQHKGQHHEELDTTLIPKPIRHICQDGMNLFLAGDHFVRRIALNEWGTDNEDEVIFRNDHGNIKHIAFADECLWIVENSSVLELWRVFFDTTDRWKSTLVASLSPSSLNTSLKVMKEFVVWHTHNSLVVFDRQRQDSKRKTFDAGYILGKNQIEKPPFGKGYYLGWLQNSKENKQEAKMLWLPSLRNKKNSDRWIPLAKISEKLISLTNEVFV